MRATREELENSKKLIYKDMVCSNIMKFEIRW